MPQKIPTIALVGPPNVGKSTLFNTIIGTRLAITGPKPGTTRDRSYGEAKWNGKKFIIIDTGGLARKSQDLLEKNIRQQTQVAMAEADIILFVADGRAPISSSLDAARELKDVLRKNKILNKIPVHLVANKIESAKNIEKIKADFARLGLGQPFALSALTGRGVGDLLDAVAEQMKKIDEEDEKEKVFATVALVGRPNAGKSTLLNHLAGEERAIVSPVPGTTRAAVDMHISYKNKLLRFIDTAGMRRRARIDLDVEEYALFQALKSMENADVVVLLLDAADVRARFEQTIAGKLKDSVKGIVIALNKIDMVSPEETTDLLQYTAARYPFLRFTQVLPISAEKGINIDKLLAAIIAAKQSRDKRIPDEDLRRDLKYWLKKHPPVKLSAQKKPVIYDLEQVKTNPPVFMLVVNEPAAIHYSYVRHLENRIREKYGFMGTAIKIRLRKPER